MERAYPSGYQNSEREMLGVRGDVRSQYDGSDTLSVTSTEDDQWGPQIGPYNENGPQYPPPPTALIMPGDDFLKTAQTIGGADMEAMLEMGFDDKPSPDYMSSSKRLHPSATLETPRYQLSDLPTNARSNAYTPVSRSEISPAGYLTSAPSSASSVTAMSTAVEDDYKQHTRKRSGGRGPGERQNYGPLGPLDPASR